VSNFIGASFSVIVAAWGRASAWGGDGLVRATLTPAGLDAAALAAAGFAAAVFGAAGLGIGLLGFTGTFEMAMDVCLIGDRAAFFGAAALWLTFPVLALPGFLAVLFGFFEGISRLRLFMRERAIIPTPHDLYRLSS
jgi:hypothetical protein